MKDSNLGGLGDYDGFGWDGMGDPVEGGPIHPMYGALASGIGTGVTVGIEEWVDNPTAVKYAELIGLGVDVVLGGTAAFFPRYRAAGLTLIAAGIASHGPRAVQKYLAYADPQRLRAGERPGFGMPVLVPSNRLGLGETQLVPRGNSLGAPRTRLLGSAGSTPGTGAGRSGGYGAGARILNSGIAPGHFGHSVMNQAR